MHVIYLSVSISIYLTQLCALQWYGIWSGYPPLSPPFASRTFLTLFMLRAAFHLLPLHGLI